MTRHRCLSGSCAGTRAKPRPPTIYSPTLDRLAWCEDCRAEAMRWTLDGPPSRGAA